MTVRSRTLLAIGIVMLVVSRPVAAGGPIIPSGLDCAAPPALQEIAVRLDRSAARLEKGQALTILAIGSSSTRGVGASSSAMSYPSQLERELRRRIPTIAIKIVNDGIGGQDVGEELGRLDRDVAAFDPDLAIWQLGTNAVLRRDDLDLDRDLIERGVGLLKKSGVDVVLMDLQYAPRVLARPASAEMEVLLADIARRARVGLFRRFAIMQEWDRSARFPRGAMIGPDGLHMTDASYGCLAIDLAGSLSANWTAHARDAAVASRGVAHAAVAALGLDHPAPPPSNPEPSEVR